ncbi:MAG: HAMP domain-containing sensor histidine kinase [Salinivirgaceae bacterium]|jgi:two-component system phosphate regulon sensor histidine kinase PhoR|nr:HAMP domain-containing sensor histidine kinase [Salinivirgaceae bacterium]
MKNTIPKIGIILIAVIVFPTLFFSAYEVTNLSKNQQVVDSIYSSQLENIVSSLNQYSVDAITRWADNIDNAEMLDREFMAKALSKFVNFNITVKGIFLLDKTNLFAIYTDSSLQASNLLHTINIREKLQSEDSTVLQLLKYIKSGYRKIAPVKIQNDSISMFLFALYNNDSSINIGGMIIDSKAFIPEVLGPKIQSMAQDRFIISVSHNNDEVYSNQLVPNQDRRIRLKEHLWLFNEFEVGIQLQNDPVEQMVKKRTQTNILMIVLMDLVLLIGAWFVYRSIRKEIHLAQIKAEFVSNVSHEIKTPLALINMYSETLEMGRVPTEEKKIEYFRVINKEAKRLARMVNKILNFSKIESGKREYHFIETEINEIVEPVVATYQHHFKNSGFKYVVLLGENLPLINADEEAITDALTNMIDNGIKYSTDTKLIEISTGLNGNNVFVKVKDSGIGIKEKEQKLIFDKFYRVTDGNLANIAKGSGIGLNIVKSIMEAHGGNISIESTFGEGSSFKMNFPIV